jgi:hypothetical protein
LRYVSTTGGRDMPHPRYFRQLGSRRQPAMFLLKTVPPATMSPRPEFKV